jgi:tetratricopeptide (TPR) repeat protein
MVEKEWPDISFFYQKVYDEMNFALPRQLISPESMNAMLYKGHYILDYTYKIFLQECKSTNISQFSNKLIEDIPTIISEEYEYEWLQNSRELDEIENIFITALELAKDTLGENQEFNIANSYVKLGKLARFRRDWDSAINNLNEAINRLKKIRIRSHEVSVLKELADAYFILGEVYMAIHRQNNNEKEKNMAENNFQLSIELDKELKQDYSTTSNRLNDF